MHSYKTQNCKFPEGNIAKNLDGLRFSNEIMNINKFLNKLDIIKIKNFCCEKCTVNKYNKSASGREFLQQNTFLTK